MKLHTATPLLSVMIYHVLSHEAAYRCLTSISHDILSYEAVYITQYQDIRFYNAESLYLTQYVKTYCPGKPHTSVSRHNVASVTLYCCYELCALSVLWYLSHKDVSVSIYTRTKLYVAISVRLYCIYTYYSASWLNVSNLWTLVDYSLCYSR